MHRWGICQDKCDVSSGHCVHMGDGSKKKKDRKIFIPLIIGWSRFSNPSYLVIWSRNMFLSNSSYTRACNGNNRPVLSGCRGVNRNRYGLGTRPLSALSGCTSHYHCHLSNAIPPRPPTPSTHGYYTQGKESQLHRPSISPFPKSNFVSRISKPDNRWTWPVVTLRFLDSHCHLHFHFFFFYHAHTNSLDRII